VVGIVVAKLNALGIASVTGDIPQNVNFAIKASAAVSFLDAEHVVHTDSAGTVVLSTPDIAERAKALTPTSGLHPVNHHGQPPLDSIGSNECRRGGGIQPCARLLPLGGEVPTAARGTSMSVAE
jgi:hypothetical protein